jgi:DNA end-binding protein Ku
MREGMAGKAAIGKVALYGREYLVAIQPRENGLVMYTLRHAEEVRSMDAIDELKLVPAKIKPDEVKLARQVIGNFETEGDLTQYKDDYQEALRTVIDAKVAGEEVSTPQEEAPPKVVNLMEALRQSLEKVSTTKKKSARIEAGKAKTAELGRNSRAEAAPRRRARG